MSIFGITKWYYNIIWLGACSRQLLWVFTVPKSRGQMVLTRLGKLSQEREIIWNITHSLHFLSLSLETQIDFRNQREYINYKIKDLKVPTLTASLNVHFQWVSQLSTPPQQTVLHMEVINSKGMLHLFSSVFVVCQQASINFHWFHWLLLMFSKRRSTIIDFA